MNVSAQVYIPPEYAHVDSRVGCLPSNLFALFSRERQDLSVNQKLLLLGWLASELSEPCFWCTVLSYMHTELCLALYMVLGCETQGLTLAHQAL